MKAAAEYSSVTVRVPFSYAAEHEQEMIDLYEKFPGIDLCAGFTDRIIVMADQASDCVEEVDHWTRQHSPPAGQLP